MTTVAYTKKFMACDSLWTHGDLKAVSRTKIMRLRSGALLGFSGYNDARWLQEVLEKISKPSQMPHPSVLRGIKVSAAALLVLQTGEIFVIDTVATEDPEEDEEIGITQISFPYWAVGSGSHLAIGAMAGGRSARDAVAIGCLHDPNSGTPIHQLSLGKPKHAKRK